MIDRDDYREGEVPGQEDENLNDLNPRDLDQQEQLNSNNLSQRIEEENQTNSDYGDVNEAIDKQSQGEEDLAGFTERELPPVEGAAPIGSDKPVTKNLLGDNPPGSEQAAFDAGMEGDMSSAQAKYNDENIVENFRENLDRTESQLDLDKRLRENRQD
ncbi:hypothetical protein [Pedobacter sp. SYSU D00535]|uniref:hypothetical protein n=1 Tax=Pedobacter sp. SYSU D00535 TaxID=2810308 RepID=UPI001A96807D|nr:hypothetical protein [Pedobacter sp. SYSU D00535]